MSFQDMAWAVEQENKAIEELRAMANDYHHVLYKLWHLNDGAGGGVLAFIAEELGLPTNSPNKKRPCWQKPYRKEKISSDIRKAVFESNRYRCVLCESHLDLTVDHIKPESKGGTLELSNLQTLCRSCNSSKGAKE